MAIFALMQKALIIFIVSFSLLVFTGCPYGSTFSAGDQKKATLIKKLAGTWQSNGPGLSKMKISDLKKNLKGYQLNFEPGTTYDPQGMMQLDTTYTVHINKVEGSMIASVREPAPEGKFYFYKVEMKAPDTLITYEVDEKRFEKDIYKTADEFRSSLASKIKEKGTLFIEKKVWVRKKK